MADPQDTAAHEPSMEEILASIRKIIVNEKDAALPSPPEAGAELSAHEDVLELTEITPSAPEPVASSVPEPSMVSPPASSPMDLGDGLVSDRVVAASSSSLSALADAVETERRASSLALAPQVQLGNGAQTVEGLVVELMKPMLKTWLDQNLSGVVERLVQKEVERITRRTRD